MEQLLPEVSEEVFTILPETANVTSPLSPFSPASSTLRFHYPSLNSTTILDNKSNGGVRETNLEGKTCMIEGEEAAGLAEKKK